MFNPPILLAAYGLTKVQEEHMLLGRKSYRNFSNSVFPKPGDVVVLCTKISIINLSLAIVRIFVG
jgi:hypothetical protein